MYFRPFTVLGNVNFCRNMKNIKSVGFWSDFGLFFAQRWSDCGLIFDFFYSDMRFTTLVYTHEFFSHKWGRDTQMLNCIWSTNKFAGISQPKKGRGFLKKLCFMKK